MAGTLQEKEQIVRHAACRVITSIAKIDLENGEWLDVVDVLLQAASSPDPRQRGVGTYLLFTCLETIGETMNERFQEMLQIFSKTIRKRFRILSRMPAHPLTQTKGDPESAEVRINTMLALSRLAIVLDTNEDKASLKILQNAIPQMVAVLKQAIDEQDDDRTTQSFEVNELKHDQRLSFIKLIDNQRSSKRYLAAIPRFSINILVTLYNL